MNAILGYATAALLLCAPPARTQGQDQHLIDVVVLAELIEAWGPCSPPCPYDLDGDGVVDADDLAAFVEKGAPEPGGAAGPHPVADTVVRPAVLRPKPRPLQRPVGGRAPCPSNRPFGLRLPPAIYLIL